MRNVSVIIIGIFIICSSSFAQPDTLWTKTFGGNYQDEGYSVQQTSDEGYIVAGTTWSFGNGGQFYLIKTDASGQQQWSQNIGFNLAEEGCSVQQTSDGGYIIAGHTISIGAGNWDVFLVKTDSSGNAQWYRTYGGAAVDYSFSVQQTTDGGYIIAGWTMSFGAGDSDVYLIKTDADGFQQWTQTFGGSYPDESHCVRQTSDGGYIIVGETWSSLYSEGNVFLIKTDASGNEQWSQSLGGDNYDEGYSVQQTTDGGYIVAGYTTSYGAGSTDVYLIKTDASGDELWSQTFGGTHYDEGYSVQQTTDGGYVITGYTFSYGAGQWDVYLIKTDDSGNEQWSQTFGGSSDDQGYCVQQTDDEGYIITGITWSYGANESNVWLVRVEPETTPDITVALTPSNPPIQVPPGGGTFEFNIEIANNGASAVGTDIWTMVTLPNGSEYGPIINVNFALPPGLSANRDRFQAVPASAPSGMYTYDAYVGIYPDQVWDEDHFDFEKITDGEGIAVTQ